MIQGLRTMFIFLQVVSTNYYVCAVVVENVLSACESHFTLICSHASRLRHVEHGILSLHLALIVKILYYIFNSSTCNGRHKIDNFPLLQCATFQTRLAVPIVFPFAPRQRDMETISISFITFLWSITTRTPLRSAKDNCNDFYGLTECARVLL